MLPVLRHLRAWMGRGMEDLVSFPAALLPEGREKKGEGDFKLPLFLYFLLSFCRGERKRRMGNRKNGMNGI